MSNLEAEIESTKSWEVLCLRLDSNQHSDNPNYPLKVACIPISPRRLKKGSDLAGARTQDPLLKREMLYQLSYQV